jgi:hypothetical protein
MRGEHGQGKPGPYSKGISHPIGGGNALPKGFHGKRLVCYNFAMPSKPDNYLALLRGINVGGKMKVNMAELKACFEKLGYGHVQTYGNSGNVIKTFHF